MILDQYYYIVNDKPKYMTPIKPTHKPSFECEFVKKETQSDKEKVSKPVKQRKKAVVKEPVEEVKVEEMSEFDAEAAKKHLQPLQQDSVAETIAADTEQTESAE